MDMVCETCAGTKLCGPCDGRGEFEDGLSRDACGACDGDGVCVECDGTGEIADPDQIEFEFDEMGVGE
jgi:hypothetical protein